MAAAGRHAWKQETKPESQNTLSDTPQHAVIVVARRRLSIFERFSQLSQVPCEPRDTYRQMTELSHSARVSSALIARFRATGIHRPMRMGRYEEGQYLTLRATPVTAEPQDALVSLAVERYVGGGYAGQVYRVRVTDMREGRVPGLEPGRVYALKLLVPPTRAARLFRDMLYAVGFQGPFQPQRNPAAARAGALWQKLIRRGAAVWFGDESVVNDIYATVVDLAMGCCGDLSEWVDGRTWRLEVDDRLDYRALWRRGLELDPALLGSPEYRAKRRFMRSFVCLLHAMGAHEFARQYEWWTCKSQPNCLKRLSTDSTPEHGVVAVDFRAGLTLLPFLPMSPADIRLILQGIGRGSLVQFDRGNLRKLERFVNEHREAFGDLIRLIPELKISEQHYRDALPDITHHGLRLLYSRTLWRTMCAAAVTGWHVSGIVDEAGERRLRGRPGAVILFGLLGVVPFVGTLVRRLWCHELWRSHYRCLCSSLGYAARVLAARRAETALAWYRARRISEHTAERVADSGWTFLMHIPFSVFPAGAHRFLTDKETFRRRLYDIFLRPLRLYFDAALREQWLAEMVEGGRRKYMISDDDAAAIMASIKEPFIQKYLQSLAVHVCTLPVTQIVSVSLALAYVLMHPEMPRAEAWTIAAGIIALFQVVPVSPGSLVRGLYVLYLVIRERNVKDYGIALGLGFFKYVGYLSFPIQMTYRYPALARFMAGHWATEAVHVVPVFGERGALLERWAFDTCYNWPLTIRRRIRERAQRRAKQRPRRWPAAVASVAVAAGLAALEYLLWSVHGVTPAVAHAGWALVALTFTAGATVTAAAGGCSFGGRIVQALAAGMLGTGAGAVAAGLAVSLALGAAWGTHIRLVDIVWRLFVSALFSLGGVLATELLMPDPAVAEAAAKVRRARRR